MLVELRRKKIKDSLRSKQIEKIMSSLRSQMSNKLKKMGISRFKVEQKGQQLVLQHIKHYSEGKEQLAAAEILLFIEENSQLGNDFQNKFTELVIQHLLKEILCLEALSVLIQKGGKIQILDSLNIKELIHVLFHEQHSRSKTELETILKFLMRLFSIRSVQVQEFKILKDYWSQISRLEITSLVFIDFMVLLGKENILTIPQELTSKYLQINVSYAPEKLPILSGIFQIIRIYFTQHNQFSLLSKFLDWVDMGLPELQFTFEISSIFSINLSQMLQRNANKSEMASMVRKHALFRKILNSQFLFKTMIDLVVLILSELDLVQRQQIIQREMVLEKVLDLLSQQISNQVKFECLSALVPIFEADDVNLKKAVYYGGLESILNECYLSDNIRIVEMTGFIFEHYQTE